MSELHLEISELLEAGVNIWDLKETHGVAKRWGFTLTATSIETDPVWYLDFITEWFTPNQKVLVA